MNSGEFVGELGALASDVLQSGGVQVAIKTNLGPEFRVGEGGGGGLARALGIKAAVIVRDRNGRQLFTHGEPPATNWLLAGALGSVLVLLGFLLVRGLVKR
jgi:hypothetical protein